VKEEGRSGTHSEESKVDAIKGGEIADAEDSEKEESQLEARQLEDLISSRHFVCMYPMFTRW
jgi:hypothetical protein